MEDRVVTFFVFFLQLVLLLPPALGGPTSIDSGCRIREDVHQKSTLEKRLVLITSFGGWELEDIPMQHTYQADCEKNHVVKKKRSSANSSWFLMNQYETYLGQSDQKSISKTEFHQTLGGYCLARHLGFKPGDTEDHREAEHAFVGYSHKKKIMKQNFGLNYVYFSDANSKRRECPSIKSYQKIYHTGNFDFMHIMLPVDRNLSPKVTRAFYEKYVQPLCKKYKGCAVVSLGENPNQVNLDSKPFDIETDVIQYNINGNQLYFESTQNMTGKHVLNIQNSSIVRLRISEGSSICHNHALATNRYFTNQCEPTPFLFIHLRKHFIYDIPSDELCAITQSFDDVLQGLFQN